MNPVETLVEHLRQQLTVAPLPDALTLAGQLGTVQEETDSAVYVRPASPALGKVLVSRDRKTGALRHVELILADPGSLRVDSLTRAYGDPAIPPRVSWDSPTRLIYRPPAAPDQPYRCVIIAALTELGQTGTDPLATVKSVVLMPEHS